ncbi:unnamed protein product [Vitrella brassicaformis CCMP3155]|uniref:Uncharacterized protein n=1 Tax=Vitrella brassicaformis (strain CCMP3155) TaxID=1169540 RepID=A0A0G4GVN3_VITBC|nr:unnamed protein product [Vitrella brassicaformis CCMP3155]|eukprot:CEM34795.1 unnamed protein product [Vitrella brassicaformis CCMP3155]
MDRSTIFAVVPIALLLVFLLVKLDRIERKISDAQPAHDSLRRLQVDVEDECPDLYSRIQQAIDEGYTFKPDKLAILRGDNQRVVKTAEYLDTTGIFGLLEANLTNVDKIETIYLRWTYPIDPENNTRTQENVYLVQSIRRFTNDSDGTPVVEVDFVGGDKLVLIAEGANLFVSDDMDRPIAVFKGPAADANPDAIEYYTIAEEDLRRSLQRGGAQTGARGAWNSGLRVGVKGDATRTASNLARGFSPDRGSLRYLMRTS